MSDVVRLRGEDRDVVEVADAALRSLGSSHASWVADVRRLHLMRRDLMRQLGAGAHGATRSGTAQLGASQRAGDAGGEAEAGAGLTRAWWVALSVGAAAAVTGSAPMLPPRHPQDPGLIMAIAPPAIAIAAVLLLLTAATLPRAARGSTAVALAAMSGVFALAALAVNLFRGDALVDAGGTAGVIAWMVGAALAVVGSVVLLLRARPERAAAEDAAASQAGKAWRSAAVELRGDAKRLLRRAPSDASVDERWSAELAGLDRTVDEASSAHARELGPWAWLVWSAYDGDIPLPQLLAR